MTLLFFTVLIFAFSVGYLALPLLQGKKSPSLSLEGLHQRDLILKKEEVLNELKDIELDHQMNKIDTHDYQALFQETLKAGTKILGELEQIEKRGEKKIEPRMVTKRPKFCIHCGQPLQPEGKYCGECGEKI